LLFMPRCILKTFTLIAATPDPVLPHPLLSAESMRSIARRLRSSAGRTRSGNGEISGSDNVG